MRGNGAGMKDPMRMAGSSPGHDGLLVVRAELCDRLNSLQQVAGGMTVCDMVTRLGTIRTMAAAYGLYPVVILVDALERAIRTEPRGCPAGLYFDRIRDAIGCDRIDHKASESLLASIQVRFGA